jgi:importin subunit beta-1
MQAIEFWSSVCEVESEIIMENNPDRVHHRFANAVYPTIVQILLQLLTLVEEGDEEDDWNVPLAAGTCISLFAGTVGPDVLKEVLPFVEQNLASPNWKFRDAAIMAMGSALEPIEQGPYVDQINAVSFVPFFFLFLFFFSLFFFF